MLRNLPHELRKLVRAERAAGVKASRARVAVIAAGFGDLTTSELRAQLTADATSARDKRTIAACVAAIAAHSVAYSSLMQAAAENGLEWWQIPEYI